VTLKAMLFMWNKNFQPKKTMTVWLKLNVK